MIWEHCYAPQNPQFGATGTCGDTSIEVSRSGNLRATSGQRSPYHTSLDDSRNYQVQEWLPVFMEQNPSSVTRSRLKTAVCRDAADEDLPVFERCLHYQVDNLGATSQNTVTFILAASENHI
jgi:hypothetical protein